MIEGGYPFLLRAMYGTKEHVIDFVSAEVCMHQGHSGTTVDTSEESLENLRSHTICLRSSNVSLALVAL
jgi:hypothetical protein